MANWDIRAEGRAWRSEALDRYSLTPKKLEMIGGKLLYDDEQRLTLLALLLENVGADATVRLGSPVVWRAAVAKLEDTDGLPGRLVRRSAKRGGGSA